jgi:hypothetical protein
MNQLPRERVPQAATTLSALVQVGGSFGTAVLVLALTRRIADNFAAHGLAARHRHRAARRRPQEPARAVGATARRRLRLRVLARAGAHRGSPAARPVPAPPAEPPTSKPPSRRPVPAAPPASHREDALMIMKGLQSGETADPS